MIYRGLFLADIHIGVMKYEQTCTEMDYLYSLLANYTAGGKLLDFIIIGGDYFDKQFYSSDEFIALAGKVMVKLLSSTRILRIVYGTASHDSDQYSMFRPLFEEVPSLVDIAGFDVKVIRTVTEEELLPGMKVLYIPEEYIYDKATYYGEFLSKEKEYDYIFGHGQIYELIGKKTHEEVTTKKSDRLRVPVFSSRELSYACNGDVIFGHYHVHCEMNDHVSYVGSLSRWTVDEDESKEDKGFYQLFYDPETRKSTKTFVINEAALVYITMRFGYKDPVFENSENWEPTAQKILKARISRGIDYLRVIFNIPVGYDSAEAFMLFFKEKFKGISGVRVEFSNGYVEKKLTGANERVAELPSEYRVFIDKNVPLEEKISAFLKLKRELEIPAEVIKEAME